LPCRNRLLRRGWRFRSRLRNRVRLEQHRRKEASALGPAAAGGGLRPRGCLGRGFRPARRRAPWSTRSRGPARWGCWLTVPLTASHLEDECRKRYRLSATQKPAEGVARGVTRLSMNRTDRAGRRSLPMPRIDRQKPPASREMSRVVHRMLHSNNHLLRSDPNPSFLAPAVYGPTHVAAARDGRSPVPSGLPAFEHIPPPRPWIRGCGVTAC
jgi:hypothetical protein